LLVITIFFFSLDVIKVAVTLSLLLNFNFSLGACAFAFAFAFAFVSNSSLNVREKSLDRAALVENLDVGTVRDELALLLESDVLRLKQVRETPLLGDDDFLSTRELVHGSREGIDSLGLELIRRSDGEQDLADIHTGALAVRLTEGVSHTLLKSISAGAGKHLVDTDRVPRVGSDTEVEGVLTNPLDHVLVAGDTAGLQSLRGDVLLLEADQVDDGRECISLSLLLAGIVDLELRIGDTSVIARLRVRLAGPVAVAACRSSSHFICLS
jgi:hypothetical protein